MPQYCRKTGSVWVDLNSYLLWPLLAWGISRLFIGFLVTYSFIHIYVPYAPQVIVEKAEKSDIPDIDKKK